MQGNRLFRQLGDVLFVYEEDTLAENVDHISDALSVMVDIT